MVRPAHEKEARGWLGSFVYAGFSSLEEQIIPKFKFSAFILRNKCGGLNERYSPIGSGVGTGDSHLRALFGEF